MNVADYIANELVRHGIRHVFGFQGGAILKLIDAMMDTGKITYVQNYHEQASAFCADSYSRVTGGIGVAMATSGPGATNLITGIANAQLDSIATLFITGQDYTTHIAKAEGVRLNGFQDLDIVSVVKPITKYAVTITSPERVGYELAKALYTAASGRPGAVLLDIPIDIQFKDIDPDTMEKFVPLDEVGVCDHEAVNTVIKLLLEAKRPVILAGGGVRISKTQAEFVRFARKTGIPVVTTLNGLDACEGHYSFSGLHGNTFSNLAVFNADVLIVLGARLGLRQVGKVRTNYTNAKVIHVDIDPSELSRVFPDSVSVLADLKSFFEVINRKIEAMQFPSYISWHEKIQEWEARYGKNTHMNKECVDPVAFIKDLAGSFAEDAIIVADVGQNQMWVAQAIRIRGEQRLLNSTGLGSMGYSLPAAIGAHIAAPGKQVIAFMGDGGLHMNMQEFLLVGQKQMNIKAIVLNNNTLGMMREVQKRYYNSHYYGASKEDFGCVDLDALAKTFKLKYYCVTAERQAAEVATLLANDEPYIIEVKVAFDSLLLNRYDEGGVFEQNRLND